MVEPALPQGVPLAIHGDDAPCALKSKQLKAPWHTDACLHVAAWQSAWPMEAACKQVLQISIRSFLVEEGSTLDRHLPLLIALRRGGVGEHLQFVLRLLHKRLGSRYCQA